MQKKFYNIKTNLVTGFLGSGKTSAVLHLMSQKPADETWSVLVNEFGAIGIDGAIYETKGISVKEIPGGCMCCASGVSLEVAINQLIKATDPDHILIEPSGIGHPKRILDTLQGEHFKDVLKMQASICLVDPRKILDSRYISHETFIDQINLADIIVANKVDLCDELTINTFKKYITDNFPEKKNIKLTKFGRLDISLLEHSNNKHSNAQFPKHHEGAISEVSVKDGFRSLSCTFETKIAFNNEKLLALFRTWSNTRIKAVLNTSKGWNIFNIDHQEKQLQPIKNFDKNFIEVIVREGEASKEQPNSQQELEQKMNACIELIEPL